MVKYCAVPSVERHKVIWSPSKTALIYIYINIYIYIYIFISYIKIKYKVIDLYSDIKYLTDNDCKLITVTGAYLALPSSVSHEKEPKVDKYQRNYSLPFKHHDLSRDTNEPSNYKRVHFEPENARSSELRKFSLLDSNELPEYRKPRKLPSIDVIKSRLASRHKLEDEGSSFGSGGSAE